MAIDYLEVTELAGDEVAREQLERILHRYTWAAEYCHGRDVLEAACGTGQGLGVIASKARTLSAGDCSPAMIQRVRAHYGERFDVSVFDAQTMPFADNSLDTVILFEAIYYLPDAARFLSECKRVLRSNGVVLVATANKDLYDFNPSPHSYRYYGIREMSALFDDAGFSAEFFGYCPVDKMSALQRVLRFGKALAARTGLMPKTMAGKKWLKRLVFGGLVPMPAELAAGMMDYYPPTRLNSDKADSRHKVIYCAAHLN